MLVRKYTTDHGKVYKYGFGSTGKTLSCSLVSTGQDNVLLPKRQQKLCPSQIFRGNTYSSEFESYWQYIFAVDADCYLEGAEQTIQQLLSPEWEVVECARCRMPCPVAISESASPVCLCVNLSSWPNTKLPSPRAAVDNKIYLARIQQRLAKSNYD
ncbi:MAG: hypothetical protein ACTMUB_05130 [cyanobacterium endosymbiont of Rhopalodia musculus]|uniref:hypothetical protein n=1 Tax=cyanobacterium endosymbiont of Epithemia clementina EcSB TaxID=3034674 RepID=UPI00315D008C